MKKRLTQKEILALVETLREDTNRALEREREELKKLLAGLE